MLHLLVSKISLYFHTYTISNHLCISYIHVTPVVIIIEISIIEQVNYRSRKRSLLVLLFCLSHFCLGDCVLFTVTNLVCKEKKHFVVLQEFVNAKEYQEETHAHRTTRRTIEQHLGDLVLELFFDLFREKCSLVRPDCRRTGLVLDFLGDHRSLLCVRPVSTLPDELREH